jgi:hypothetical protein
MSYCHCNDDEDTHTDICDACGNPLGPFNMTYLCKSCTRLKAKGIDPFEYHSDEPQTEAAAEKPEGGEG